MSSLSCKKLNISPQILDANLSCSKQEDTPFIRVDFLEKNNQIEPRRFYGIRTDLLSSPSYYGAYMREAVSSGISVDVQPINGITKHHLLKNIFRPSCVDDLRKQLQYLASRIDGMRSFVLDVKDSHALYQDSIEIANSEREVIEFFNGRRINEKSARQEVFDLVRDNSVRYVFLEGSLKNRIVTSLATPDQAEFLQNASRGKEVLCMMCELIMNLFKQGYDVQTPLEANPDAKVYSLRAKDFIAPLTPKVQPGISSIGTTALLTLYPEHYKFLYGAKEQYYEAVSSTYQTVHNFDDATGTTAITIQE